MCTYTKSATSLQSDCCPLVAFLVSVGVEDGFETVRIQVALQRLVGALKVETARDEGSRDQPGRRPPCGCLPARCRCAKPSCYRLTTENNATAVPMQARASSTTRSPAE